MLETGWEKCRHPRERQVALKERSRMGESHPDQISRIGYLPKYRNLSAMAAISWGKTYPRI
jgi:hypothetical protein